MSPLTEEVSLKVLGYIISNEDLTIQFFEASGMSPQDLKSSVGSEETWAAMLDFILSDDLMIVDFCKEQSLKYEDLWKARNNLPGSPASACMSV